MLGYGLNINKQQLTHLAHLSTWDTTQISAGSSNNNQIKIPTEAAGTYNCEVFWGDGNSDVITTWNDVAWTHTYASSGIYQIKIVGTCHGFRFNGTGDRLKLLSIENGGKEFRVSSNGSQFFGCGNLTQVSGLNTSNVTNMSLMFFQCFNINSSLSSFDTSNVTVMNLMFGYCYVFNSSLSNFDTSNVNRMDNMFLNCTNFNQLLTNFNTSNVTNMIQMFFGCPNFNQDISNFDIESVTDITDMCLGATSWSPANYGLFLNEIANNQNVVDSLSFRCSSKYPASAAAARADLIATDLWTITDGGPE